MKPDYSLILAEAFAAAGRAVAVLAHEEGKHGLDCGFAWATVNGNSGLARYCRKHIKACEKAGQRAPRNLGSKAWPSGWQFWNPGDYAGQSVHIIEAGARAFRDSLARHGVAATVSSRLD